MIIRWLEDDDDNRDDDHDVISKSKCYHQKDAKKKRTLVAVMENIRKLQH
jgi:hypothetical protein